MAVTAESSQGQMMKMSVKGRRFTRGFGFWKLAARSGLKRTISPPSGAVVAEGGETWLGGDQGLDTRRRPKSLPLVARPFEMLTVTACSPAAGVPSVTSAVVGVVMLSVLAPAMPPGPPLRDPAKVIELPESWLFNA